MATAEERTPERVIEIEDETIGLEAVLVIDRFVEGTAAGGIRRAPYASSKAAREDARALARAMSIKCALAELPSGGAKTVLQDTGTLDTEAAYRAIGDAVEELDGAYLCGPDVGTGERELDIVRERTEHVNPRGNEPARRTAQGVLAGIDGLFTAIEDPAGVEGSRFVVQGYGSVGARVAEGLDRAGGEVLVSEVSGPARDQAREDGFELVDPEAATSTPCTVFVPCALGGVLTTETARSLPARGVCGSANEQLATPHAARILHDRGIAYAPDVLVNAGAVIEGVLTAREGRTKRVLAEVGRRIAGIQARIEALLLRSREEDVPTHRLAIEAAFETLDGA